MSSRSSEPRRANRGPHNTIIIFLLLLVASLSATMPRLAEIPSQPQSGAEFIAASVAPNGGVSAAPAARNVFVDTAAYDAARSYEPSVGTSDAAGALGFWILLSVCGALLAAGFGPWLLQWLRRRGS